MVKLIWQVGKVGIKILGVIAFLGIIFWVLNTSAQIITNKQADALEQKAKDYRENHQYVEAEQVYQTIIKEYSSTDYALRAYGNLASLYIELNNIQASEEVRDALISNFSKHPELIETLCNIVRSYEWLDRFEDAKNSYQQIMQNNFGNMNIDVSNAELGFFRASIHSLILSREYEQVEQAITELTSDFNGHPDLPDTLYWIGRRYEWSDKFDEAKNIFQQIVQQYPQSKEAERAQLGISRMDIYSFIISGQIEAAQAEINKITSDFHEHPDLPDTLYWIGQRYGWSDEYELARDIFQQIIQNYPESSYAIKSELDFYKTNILSLIVSGEYEQAKQAIAELTSTFYEHPDFPATLYWIAERYSWARKYEDANKFYQQVIQYYPNSSYAQKSLLGVSSTNVLSLILSHKYTESRKAVDELVSNFSGNIDLTETLYEVARRYEWANRYEDASCVYQKIVQKYSDSDKFQPALFGVSRNDICYLIITGQWDEARTAIGEMTVNFSENPDFLETLYNVARRYEWSDNFDEAKIVYQQIFENYPNSSFANKAKVSSLRMNILSLMVSENYSQAKIAINELIDGFSINPDLPEALYNIAQIYGWLNKYEESKNIYQQIIQNYCESSYASKANLGLTMSEMMLSLVKLGEYDYQVKMDIDNFLKNFAGHPDLPNWSFIKQQIHKVIMKKLKKCFKL